MKQIKIISNSNRKNVLHKGYQHGLHNIKQTLKDNDVTMVKTDKSKAIVLIKTEDLNKKFEHFIKENNIGQINKDPTEKYQKMIQQTIKRKTLIFERQQYKFLTNIKPAPPKLNIYIKTHKQKKPIRPVINNTEAPTYKVAKYINKKLQQLLNLPNAYSIKNSLEISEELKNIRIKENNRMLTIDIKELYVNLPVNGVLKTTRHWLHKNNNSETTITQMLNVIETILQQNYFQYKDGFFQPKKGIAMGSPISGTVAEMYIQYVEAIHIKQWWETGEICYYKRYVDDILIIYNNHKIKNSTIKQRINTIDKNLEFKMTPENSNTINFLDLTLHRNSNNIELSMYRKPTSTDTTIHYKSNHPHEHKMATFRFFINRMTTLPMTKESKTEEWKTIITTAAKIGYPSHIIHNLKKKVTSKRMQKEKHEQENEMKQPKKWITFTYHSPPIRRITNLFKDTNTLISFRTTNTIQQ